MTNEIMSALAEQLNEFKKGVVSAEQMNEAIKGIEEKIAENKNEQELLALRKSVEDVKTSIKEVKNSANKQAEVKGTFGEAVAEKIMASGDNRYKGEFKMKAVGAETLAGSVAVANPAPVLSTIVDAEVYKLNRRKGADILDYVNVGTTDRATIVYVDEVGGEGAANTTAEGAVKNQTDVDFAEKVSNAIKYTAFVKISEEMLGDAPRLAQAVDEITADKVYQAVVSGVVSTAIANANNYSLTDFNGAVPDANEADAIHAALVESEQSGFVPNALVINPIDFGKLRFIKATDGTPVISYYGEGRFPVFSDNLAIIKRADIPVGTFVVGDLNAIKVRFYQQAVELGYDGDDFTRNMRTLRAENRVHIYVPTTEGASLVKGTFATMIEALDGSNA